jgi:hypothetical protein
LKTIIGTLLCCVTASAGSQANHRPESPNQAPPGCSTVIATSLNVTSGSASYLALRYQLAALDEAEDAIIEGNKLTETISSATDPSALLTSMLSGYAAVEDDFHCSAYLVGNWHPADPDLKNVPVLLVDLYNRKANFIAVLSEKMKRGFAKDSHVPTKAEQVKDAEHQVELQRQGKQASTDLLDYTTFTLMKAVDLSDPNAKTTEYLSMSCTERADILERSSKLRGEGNVDGNDFRVTAGLIAKMIGEHKCHASSGQ